MNQGSAQGFMNFREKQKVQKTVVTPGVGHNSGAGLLKDYADRLENLETEKQSFVDDIKDLCTEAKGVGLDVKALKRVVKLKMMGSEQREKLAEQEAVVDTYKQALGMLD